MPPFPAGQPPALVQCGRERHAAPLAPLINGGQVRDPRLTWLHLQRQNLQRGELRFALLFAFKLRDKGAHALHYRLHANLAVLLMVTFAFQAVQSLRLNPRPELRGG